MKYRARVFISNLKHGEIFTIDMDGCYQRKTDAEWATWVKLYEEVSVKRNVAHIYVEVDSSEL